MVAAFLPTEFLFFSRLTAAAGHAGSNGGYWAVMSLPLCLHALLLLYARSGPQLCRFSFFHHVHQGTKQEIKCVRCASTAPEGEVMMVHMMLSTLFVEKR